MKLEFTHSQASHCETGATKNMLRYFGIDISEPMTYGIGSGLYFAHLPMLKMNHIPVTTFRTLPGLVFSRACKQLGLEYDKKTFSDPKKAMDELDRVLDKGLPVGLQVGVYHLPFFPPEFRMHYNMHNMSVIGKENNMYLVSDPMMENIVTISYDDLVRVCYAKGAFAPQGKMYYITKFPDQMPDLRKPIVNGIKKSVFEMTGQYFWMIGVFGIRFLSRRLRHWPEKLGEKAATQYIVQLIQMIEEIGTGGAGYRFIFGAFLREASEVLQQDWLMPVSVEMGQVAARWREFSHTGAQFVKHHNDAEKTFNQLADMLLDIADSEAAVYKKLKKISL